jgi:transcriptional regulator GlxA family with amidase domain
MQVAYLLYERFTALDITGPHDVLNSVPGTDSVFVAENAGPVRNDSVPWQSSPTAPWTRSWRLTSSSSPAVSAHACCSSTNHCCRGFAACTRPPRGRLQSAPGSLLLAAAGLLDDTPATTHWLARDTLASLGARPVPDRVVQYGKIITAAGVSSGIDMALRLVQRMHGDEAAQAIQLGIEYDPEPPFDAGSPEKAPPAIVETVTAVFGALEAELRATG